MLEMPGENTEHRSSVGKIVINAERRWAGGSFSLLSTQFFSVHMWHWTDSWLSRKIVQWPDTIASTMCTWLAVAFMSTKELRNGKEILDCVKLSMPKKRQNVHVRTPVPGGAIRKPQHGGAAPVTLLLGRPLAWNTIPQGLSSSRSKSLIAWPFRISISCSLKVTSQNFLTYSSGTVRAYCFNSNYTCICCTFTDCLPSSGPVGVASLSLASGLGSTTMHCTSCRIRAVTIWIDSPLESLQHKTGARPMRLRGRDHSAAIGFWEHANSNEKGIH